MIIISLVDENIVKNRNWWVKSKILLKVHFMKTVKMQIFLNARILNFVKEVDAICNNILDISRVVY